jgi:hypothetical protein
MGGNQFPHSQHALDNQRVRSADWEFHIRREQS